MKTQSLSMKIAGIFILVLAGVLLCACGGGDAPLLAHQQSQDIEQLGPLYARSGLYPQCVNTDCSHIAVAAGNLIEILEIKTGKLIQTLRDGYHSEIKAIRAVADKIFAINRKGYLIVWDIQSSSILEVENIVAGGIFALVTTKSNIITTTHDNAIQISDISDHTSVRSITVEEDGKVYALAASDDMIAAIISDQTVKVWNTKDGELIDTIKTDDEAGVIRTLAVSGKTVITGSNIDKGAGYYNKYIVIRTWEFSDEEKTYSNKQEIKYNSWRIHSIAATDDFIIAGSSDVTRVINRSNENIVYSLSRHNNQTHHLAVFGSKLISGSFDSTVMLWDLNTGSLLHMLGHQDGITARLMTPSAAIFGYQNGKVKVWDFKTGNILYEWDNNTSTVDSLEIVGNHLIYGSSDGSYNFTIRDLSDPHKHSSFSGKGFKINQTGDNTVLISNFTDRDTQTSIQIRDANQNKLLLDIKADIENPRFSTKIIDNKAVLGYINGAIQVWDLSNGQLLLTISGAHDRPIERVAVSKSHIISTSREEDNFTFKIWDLNTGKAIATLTHFSTPLALHMTEDNKAVFGKKDGNIEIYNLQTGSLIYSIPALKNEFINHFFTYDDQLAVFYSGGSIGIYNYLSGLLLTHLENHSDLVSYFRVTDTHYFTGGYDNQFSIWDAPTGGYVRSHLVNSQRFIRLLPAPSDRSRFVGLNVYSNSFEMIDIMPDYTRRAVPTAP